jgi:uncharacterized protein YtpQ (UPF0354 family)
MNLVELRKELTKRLASDERTVRFDRQSDKLRIENKDGGRGVTVSLPDLLKKYQEKGPDMIPLFVSEIDRGLKAMTRPFTIKGHVDRIFPVIRAASFPVTTKDGKELLTEKHTAETSIYYALDMDGSYRLIDKDALRNEGIDSETIVKAASANLQSLPTGMKKDMVKHNAFYFLNYNDGYDASRILNQQLLKHMKAKAKGDLTVAVPHQDVLIFGDIVNPEGYDILAQMVMKFYSEGRVPITILPFIFENGALEPIFIMANRRPN